MLPEPQPVRLPPAPTWDQRWESVKRYQQPDGTVLAEMSRSNGIWWLRINDCPLGSCLEAPALMAHAEQLVAQAPGLALQGQSNDSR